MTDGQAVPLPPGAVRLAQEAITSVLNEGQYETWLENDEALAAAALAAAADVLRAQGAATERERLQHRIDALLARHDQLPIWLRAEIGKLLDGGEPGGQQ